ncbi:MAG: LuxR C-terminal-related transcriptional regulator [Huintestinicola sp.]
MVQYWSDKSDIQLLQDRVFRGYLISENTVKSHVRNILKKTGCTNRSELMAVLNQN